MNKNLDRYILTFNNVISPELSEKCLKQFDEYHFRENTFINPQTGIESSFSENEPWVIDDFDDKDLMNVIWQCLKYYVDNIELPWFNSWAGFTPMRINKYELNQHMAPHCDRIKSIFNGIRKGDPTLTVLGLFGTEFEGGDLVMFEDEKYEFNPLDIMIFPSNFLYPHHTTPVTSGKRISFVSWAW